MIYVALLRGINLGSKRRVAMADLRTWVTDLGYTSVKTLLQSGNVVFQTTKRMPTVRKELEAALAAGAGFQIDCVLRTVEELRAVVEADPLGKVATEPSKYLVSFLDKPGDWPKADLTEFEPEQAHFDGREAYFWVPGGHVQVQDHRGFSSPQGRAGHSTQLEHGNEAAGPSRVDLDQL